MNSDWSQDERKQLMLDISHLPRWKLGQVVKMIEKLEPGREANAAEVELDFRALQPGTLRAMKQLVSRYESQKAASEKAGLAEASQFGGPSSHPPNPPFAPGQMMPPMMQQLMQQRAQMQQGGQMPPMLQGQPMHPGLNLPPGLKMPPGFSMGPRPSMHPGQQSMHGMPPGAGMGPGSQMPPGSMMRPGQPMPPGQHMQQMPTQFPPNFGQPPSMAAR